MVKQANQYLLFYYREYYPKGAFNDFIASFESKEDVFNYIIKLPNSLKEKVDFGNIEFQVFNMNTMHVIKLKDLPTLENVLDDSKYTALSKDMYFEDFIEDCRFEDELFNE